MGVSIKLKYKDFALEVTFNALVIAAIFELLRNLLL
jgi:hypothetical protein